MRGEQRVIRPRLRGWGLVTIRLEILEILGADEGDDLVFITDENSRVQIIPPEQAWFWSKRWQHFKNEVQ